ncbi:uncharacterized protein LOC129752295 [Uranotaenia lowii]|uniref:uncharacterized protein LOC129752295 n=1 Tax=Uranotaenia lowii TaxID=190385 RepID=UPI0024794E1D|nr:uncharacterized protein LOC129752295 [Uranotaenia lowii]
MDDEYENELTESCDQLHQPMEIRLRYEFPPSPKPSVSFDFDRRTPSIASSATPLVAGIQMAKTNHAHGTTGRLVSPSPSPSPSPTLATRVLLPPRPPTPPSRRGSNNSRGSDPGILVNTSKRARLAAAAASGNSNSTSAAAVRKVEFVRFDSTEVHHPEQPNSNNDEGRTKIKDEIKRCTIPQNDETLGPLMTSSLQMLGNISWKNVVINWSHEAAYSQLIVGVQLVTKDEFPNALSRVSAPEVENKPYS